MPAGTPCCAVALATPIEAGSIRARRTPRPGRTWPGWRPPCRDASCLRTSSRLHPRRRRSPRGSAVSPGPRPHPQPLARHLPPALPPVCCRFIGPAAHVSCLRRILSHTGREALCRTSGCLIKAITATFCFGQGNLCSAEAAYVSSMATKQAEPGRQYHRASETTDQTIVVLCNAA